MLIWHGSGYAFRHKRPPHLENYFLHITGSIDEIVFTNTGTGKWRPYGGTRVSARGLEKIRAETAEQT